MQLTQHTDFGLRLLIGLARAPEGLLAVPAFAAEHGLSYHHVAKVAQALARHGFAASVRGRNGGLRLVRPADAITVGEVVRALEPGMRLVDCASCHMRRDCALSGVLAEATAAFLAVLDRVTLAEAARPGVPAFMPWRLAPPRAPRGTEGDTLPCTS